MRFLVLGLVVACGGARSSPPVASSQPPPPPIATVDSSPLPEDPNSPNRCGSLSIDDMARCAVGVMEHYANRMCSCVDKACADTVNVELAAWGNQLAKSAGPGKGGRADPDLAKRSADSMTRYTECMTPLLMPPATTDGGDDPCG